MARIPYADRCPNCVAGICPPAGSTRLGDEMACRYTCPSCDHHWTTRWSVGAVEGWDRAEAAREPVTGDTAPQAPEREPTTP